MIERKAASANGILVLFFWSLDVGAVLRSSGVHNRESWLGPRDPGLRRRGHLLLRVNDHLAQPLHVSSPSWASTWALSGRTAFAGRYRSPGGAGSRCASATSTAARSRSTTPTATRWRSPRSSCGGSSTPLRRASTSTTTSPSSRSKPRRQCATWQASTRTTPYETGQKSLQANADEVTTTLHEDLQGHLSPAGVEVVRTQLRRLAYAPEIAGDMLRRQQAEAVVAARAPDRRGRGRNGGPRTGASQRAGNHLAGRGAQGGDGLQPARCALQRDPHPAGGEHRHPLHLGAGYQGIGAQTVPPQTRPGAPRGYGALGGGRAAQRQRPDRVSAPRRRQEGRQGPKSENSRSGWTIKRGPFGPLFVPGNRRPPYTNKAKDQCSLEGPGRRFESGAFPATSSLGEVVVHAKTVATYPVLVDRVVEHYPGPLRLPSSHPLRTAGKSPATLGELSRWQALWPY